MSLRAVAAFLIASLPPMAAAADIVPLGGSYGSEAGCRYMKDGRFGDDSVAALTGTAYETYGAGCEFVQAARSKAGDHVVTMLCSHEGEAFKSIDFMRIVKADGRDAYDLFSQAGEAIATVKRCE